MISVEIKPLCHVVGMSISNIREAIKLVEGKYVLKSWQQYCLPSRAIFAHHLKASLAQLIRV